MAKTREIKLLYGTEELEKIRKKAEELGLKPSTYVRMISLKADIKIKK